MAKTPQTLAHDRLDSEALQHAWEGLTTALLRQGYGYLWMKHFVDTEFNRLIQDPVLRKRMGVEPAHSD